MTNDEINDKRKKTSNLKSKTYIIDYEYVVHVKNNYFLLFCIFSHFPFTPQELFVPLHCNSESALNQVKSEM